MADAIIPDRRSRGKPLPKPDEATLRDLYEVQLISTTGIARRFHVRRSTVLEWFKGYGMEMRRARRPPVELQYGLDEARLRELYEVQGLSTYEIAEMVGASSTGVWNCLKRSGVQARPPSYAGKGAKPKPDESTLRRLYEVERMTLVEIAGHLQASAPLVAKWLESYGIERREPSEFFESKSPGEAALRDLYEAQRLTTREIGARYGVKHISVRRWLAACNIPLRAKGKGLAHRGIQGPTRDELDRMIREEGLCYEAVAARYGVDPSAIMHWVRKHGIEANPPGLTGRRYRCSNGLEVRSGYEIRVAEWFLARGIDFIYEPRYHFNTNMRADFGVNGWYIEIWGVMHMPRYRKQKRRKIRLCKAHDIPLIQLSHEHFTARGRHILEERLSRVLSPAPAPTVQGLLF